MLCYDLCDYLNAYLDIDSCADYAPNGLQIQGKKEIKIVVTGVSISKELIHKAIALKADAIIVHHGFFWKNENPNIVGLKHNRIKSLLENNINVLGYHLPLDKHPELGNNVLLGKLLGIENLRVVNEFGNKLVWQGTFSKGITPDAINSLLEDKLKRIPLHIKAQKNSIHNIAWCSGAAQDYIDSAAEYGFDAYISGEVSERTYYSAIEQNIHYFCAGHHATETLGIKALGEHIADKFDLIHHFIDTMNPI